MKEIHCTIIRGGSSKGVFVERSELSPPGSDRDRQILALFGSPDPRQIDGLGGADMLTSKTAIMGPPTREDCDVDYLFGQVSFTLPKIDWTSNCGNISSGAALYGVYKGYISSQGQSARVAVHQVNTGRRLLATMPLEDGMPATEGDFAIGGVPGTGARIDLDFQDFAGCIMNQGLFPTGNPIDRFEIPTIGSLEVSVIDMTNLCFCVRAADVGLDNERDVMELRADKEVVSRLDTIRASVAAAIDFIKGSDAAERLLVSVNPLLFVLGTPRSYRSLDGTPIEGENTDLFARSFSRSVFSKAYPGTGSIATTVSCGIPGTITSEMLTEGPPPFSNPYSIRIGHPSGTMEITAKVSQGDNHRIRVDSAILGRTARVLMEGVAFIR